jgi:predicted DCC family thiol-disulfide oxidoreductase YuxK
MMNTLTLFYDARCGLCSELRKWLIDQPAYVRLEFMPYDAPEAAQRLPGIQHLGADQEIVVMADTGEVWQGAAAWVMCLWALQEYRGWSERLASPALQGLARKLVHWVSRNRIGLSRLLRFRSDAELTAQMERETAEPMCDWRSRPVTATDKAWHDLDLIDEGERCQRNSTITA